MTAATAGPVPRARPEPAIQARRRDVARKLAAVDKAVKTLGRTGAPITRAGVAQLAGVSRSFTYENTDANQLITQAQQRSRTRAGDRVDTLTGQQEASWRERALNAEDHNRQLRHELADERRLLAELLGQLRDPDGTWIENDRKRLHTENRQLLAERNQLLRERDALQRQRDAARANLARHHEHNVTQLFPNGPGPASSRPPQT